MVKDGQRLVPCCWSSEEAELAEDDGGQRPEYLLQLQLQRCQGGAPEG
jgi:hypothetical protein